MYGSPATSRDLNLAFDVASGDRPMEENSLLGDHRQKAGPLSSSSTMMYCSLPSDQLLPPQEISPGNINSSPVGLFSELTLEQGDALVRGVLGQWGASTAGAKPAESRRLRSRTITPPKKAPSLHLMPGVSEIPGVPLSAWSDHTLISDSLAGFSRRSRDQPEAQNGDVGIHFSLPKTSSGMASLLQFQDAVPCKIRAKRGCATHPRSIAERERRTRISERIKKLQELVPKMDKQLSTAEMLDMALDYIKDLQEQVKNLSKSQADCTCLGNNMA